MAIPLRQSTASQEIPLGQFVDSTDGNTEENGLTIANTDIKLWKQGATTLASKNSGGATNISNGVYYCVLDATDTDTLGGLDVFVHVAGALCVKQECVVLSAANYDASISPATSLLTVNATQLAGQTITAAAGVTFPTSVASPTNITAGTITTVTTVTNQVTADVTAISGDTVAANNAEAFFDGTGYAGTNNVIPLVTTTTTATNLTNAPTNGDLTATMKTSVTTAATAATPTAAAVTGNVGGNVTGSIGSLAAQAKTDVNAEVLDVLVTDVFAEPATVPAATASLKDKIGWQAVLARNKITQTATTQTVRNDGDSGTIGAATVSDNGTTATRDEFA